MKHSFIAKSWSLFYDFATLKLINTSIFRSAPPRVSELINPGADAPEALTLFADGVPEAQKIELDTVVNGNSWRKRKDFSVIQNALSQTDLVDYTLEFIPDQIPTAESEGQSAPPDADAQEDPPEPPKSAPKKKAPPKGKGKGKKGKNKAVEGEATEEVASNQATGRKKTTSASAKPRTARAATTSTRAPSARLAAKAVRFVDPPPPTSLLPSEAPTRVLKRPTDPVASGSNSGPPANHLPLPPTRTRIWKPSLEPAASSSTSDHVGRKRERPTEGGADELPAEKKPRSSKSDPDYYHGKEIIVGGVPFRLYLR